jgi:CRP/FNR family transcriptional regulator, cyclic AMP receptor protein
MATPSAMRLFDVEPDLLARVPLDERELALRSASFTVAQVPAGRWAPQRIDASWGLLVVDGTVAREVGVAGATAAELLGAGDVVLAGGPSAGVGTVPSEAAWTVLEPLQLLILDDRMGPVARRWPMVTIGLLERVEGRAGRLAVAQAIGHLTRVDARVLCMLWLLADRWGRVGSDGVALPLRLTHRTLARLVGARRPSVTTAVSQLTRRGLIARREDGSWLLHGSPPQELGRLGMTSGITSAPPSARPAAAVSAERFAEQLRRLAAAYERQARAMHGGPSPAAPAGKVRRAPSAASADVAPHR